MLEQRPIFLGGQGGLVGPCRVGYGTVTAAGSTIRHDILKEDQIVLDALNRSIKVPSIPGKYTNIQRILKNNFIYLANLSALAQWYARVRPLFTGAEMPAELLEGLQINLNAQIAERIRRLSQLADKMTRSMESCSPEGVEYQRQEEFQIQWPDIREAMENYTESPEVIEKADEFLSQLNYHVRGRNRSYLETLASLPAQSKTSGVHWLQCHVAGFLGMINALLPGFDIH
jgi:UDP-N-acetylglucosamine/UDP-N-acetylgalactosamine diphosphorylase